LPRSGASIGSISPPSESRFLQLIQPVPASIAANAEALQTGYREYQELSLARSGLQTIYGLTLTLTLLLAIFAAIASSVLLASSMTAPLLQVAEGTKAVAEGNYRQVREFPGNDELNSLTQSFNAMTRQLTGARRSRRQAARAGNAKTIWSVALANLSAGVVVLDRDFRIVMRTTAHRASSTSWMQQAGRSPARAEGRWRRRSQTHSRPALTASPAKDSWQQQKSNVELRAAVAEPLMLLARGSRLPGRRARHVVVFDDITQVISAQRAVAWGEVARRLAHEIKNPLTPIQLAAERLQMKLVEKLPLPDADVLKRGTSTIVNQVAAMKRMVDDFRDYARVPPARLSPLDLNTLIEEVAALYGAGTEGSVLQLALQPGLPLIEGDATQLRQVIHNLVVNAQDALVGRPGPHILVRTELVELDEANTTARAVRLAVEDNGRASQRTSCAGRRTLRDDLPSGTGLGLHGQEDRVDEHRARIEVINRTGGAGVGHAGGAIVTIVFRNLAQAQTAYHRAPRRVA
jgi:nitrogen fixation/metabolism regulation signal transduction histidine kinase